MKCDYFLYLNLDENFPQIKFSMTLAIIGVCTLLQPTGKHTILVKTVTGTGDMVQQLKAHTASPLSIRQLTSTWSSSFKEQDILFWPP